MSLLKLIDVAKINMGQSPSSVTYNSEKNGLPFYQGNVDFGEKYPTARIWCNKPTKIAEPGDVLMSVRAPIGALNYANEKCCIGRGLAAITPNPDMTSSEFIYWFLRAKHSELNRIGTGSTFKAINRKTLESIELPKYNKNEQYYIAEILSKIDKTISEKKAQIDKLDNLIKARFVEMFGTREKWNDANWKIVSIDEIIEKPKSGEWGQKDESGRGIGVIRTTNFSDRGAVYFNSITTRDIPREKLITKGVKNGDILIEKSGGSDKKPVGRVVLYTGESNKYLNNNFTAILRINNNTEVNNIFLFTFLYINYWQGGTKVFESKTTGIHNLNLKEFLNKTKIALPDMSLQNQFAAFVTQVDKSKFAVQKSLEKTQLLFDSLMQEYFG